MKPIHGLASKVFDFFQLGKIERNWRTPQKDEVDIIVKGKQILPIEVKYQNQIISDDVKNLQKFCKKFRCNNGIVVTKNTLEKKTIDCVDILFIPAWFFLVYWAHHMEG
jgi:predicted AAA+ superfamily ATPase